MICTSGKTRYRSLTSNSRCAATLRKRDTEFLHVQHSHQNSSPLSSESLLVSVQRDAIDPGAMFSTKSNRSDKDALLPSLTGDEYRCNRPSRKGSAPSGTKTTAL